MIIAGAIALSIGLGQFFILFRLIDFVMHKLIAKGIILAFVKTAVYLAVFLLLIRFFSQYITVFLICFGAGYFISLAVWIMKTVKSL